MITVGVVSDVHCEYYYHHATQWLLLGWWVTFIVSIIITMLLCAYCCGGEWRSLWILLLPCYSVITVGVVSYVHCEYYYYHATLWLLLGWWVTFIVSIIITMLLCDYCWGGEWRSLWVLLTPCYSVINVGVVSDVHCEYYYHHATLWLLLGWWVTFIVSIIFTMLLCDYCWGGEWRSLWVLLSPCYSVITVGVVSDVHCEYYYHHATLWLMLGWWVTFIVSIIITMLLCDYCWGGEWRSLWVLLSPCYSVITVGVVSDVHCEYYYHHATLWLLLGWWVTFIVSIIITMLLCDSSLFGR